MNIFVAPNGNDHNPGTIERPFATLYKAHQWVRPGETINLRAGTYKALISWTKSGTPAAPITIQAYNGEDVTLQSSEQYAWTQVTDPTFGDCWKVAIPWLPIQYPGVQHTVWEEASRRAADPDLEVCAIVKGGYMCAPMHAADHFARPQAAPGIPLTDKGGKLKYRHHLVRPQHEDALVQARSVPRHRPQPPALRDERVERPIQLGRIILP